MSFTYNDEGIRTSKTVNGVKHTYHLNGSQITAEEWEDKLLVYLYDAYGSPIGMMFRKTSYIEEQWDTYWFEKNLQGDIMSVYDSAGNKVAYYSYKDAWGNHSETYINLATNEGVHYNPFRYRGYYYDSDLGMYYLQSRYYDAKICRFINADSALYHSMLGYNMFAYCENNPVNYYDPTGKNSEVLNPSWTDSIWFALLALIDGPLPIGDILCGVIGVLIVATVLKAAQNETPEKTTDKPEDPPSSLNEQGNDSSSEQKPDIKYPGNDPTVAPDGYEWRGKGPQGSKEGSYYNPETDTSLHPDLNHPDSIGPHWDYNGPEGEFRIFPDGSIEPK